MGVKLITKKQKDYFEIEQKAIISDCEEGK